MKATVRWKKIYLRQALCLYFGVSAAAILFKESLEAFHAGTAAVSRYEKFAAKKFQEWAKLLN